MALEVVLSQADSTEDLFLSLQSKDLRGLLRHRFVPIVGANVMTAWMLLVRF